MTMRSYRNCSNCFPCSLLPVVVNSNWTQVKKNHRYLVYYFGEATVSTPSTCRFYLLIVVMHRGWLSTLLTHYMHLSHCLLENHPWSLIINIHLWRLPLLPLPYCTPAPFFTLYINLYFSKLAICISFIFCINLTITVKSFCLILLWFMA